MMADRRQQSEHLLSVVAAFTTFLFFLFFFTHAQLGSQGARDDNKYNSRRSESVLLRMGGPGSWPPTCRSKCGGCGPCKPVHVPVQPGLSFPLEYYPEAWRCKCGNKLFMP
ncbi:EPIDERMAL PATTERNING FACTOR-like protein 4 [Linum grandiflorum]